MEFGEWVRQERKRLRYSQMELAERAGVSQSVITACERGKHTPYERNQRKIVKALGGVKTNGDAIRRMPDEELVFVLHCHKNQCSIPQNDRDCYQCKLDYLRSTS